MACGCPVINAAIPDSGVPWVSPDGVTGLTVPVDDPVGPGRRGESPAGRAGPPRPARRRRRGAGVARVRPPGHGPPEPGRSTPASSAAPSPRRTTTAARPRMRPRPTRASWPRSRAPGRPDTPRGPRNHPRHARARHRLQRPDRLRGRRLLRRPRGRRRRRRQQHARRLLRRRRRHPLEPAPARVRAAPVRASRAGHPRPRGRPPPDRRRGARPDRPLRRAAVARPRRADAVRGLRRQRRRHAQPPGGDPPPPARRRLRPDEHQQGLRRLPQRTPAQGARDPLGVRRRGRLPRRSTSRAGSTGPCTRSSARRRRRPT